VHGGVAEKTRRASSIPPTVTRLIVVTGEATHVLLTRSVSGGGHALSGPEREMKKMTACFANGALMHPNQTLPPRKLRQVSLFCHGVSAMPCALHPSFRAS
jgi:hypothetical protein